MKISKETSFMETELETYVAPRIEVIEMETENIIAVSPTANDNEDPDFPELSSTRRRSFWN